MNGQWKSKKDQIVFVVLVFISNIIWNLLCVLGKELFEEIFVAVFSFWPTWNAIWINYALSELDWLLLGSSRGEQNKMRLDDTTTFKHFRLLSLAHLKFKGK